MSLEQAPSSVPDPQAPRRHGWRVAALGLIGVLAVLLPLAQVLRFQVDDLMENRQERARLDPLAEAVSLQLGLIGHDKVAARVLRGRSALEGERQLRQAEVDRQVVRLKTTLWAGAWQHAHREATALQTDWSHLVAQVSQRRIDASFSHQAHRLLQEQAVQVMDLVQAQLMLPLGAESLASLLSSIDRRRAELDHRIVRAKSGLWTLGAAAATLLTGLLLLGQQALRHERLRRGHQNAARSATRQGHGRRRSDPPPRATPTAIAAAEIDAARRATEHLSTGD